MSAPSSPRRDRASRIVAVVIIAAVIVPVIWLVVSAAFRGPDALDPEMTPSTMLRSTTTTVIP